MQVVASNKLLQLTDGLQGALASLPINHHLVDWRIFRNTRLSLPNALALLFGQQYRQLALPACSVIALQLRSRLFAEASQLLRAANSCALKGSEGLRRFASSSRPSECFFPLR